MNVSCAQVQRIRMREKETTIENETSNTSMSCTQLHYSVLNVKLYRTRTSYTTHICSIHAHRHIHFYKDRLCSVVYTHVLAHHKQCVLQRIYQRGSSSEVERLIRIFKDSNVQKAPGSIPGFSKTFLSIDIFFISVFSLYHLILFGSFIL